MPNIRDKKIEVGKLEIVGRESITFTKGQDNSLLKDRWPGYKKVRQKSPSGGECRPIGALLKETPKLYVMTSELDEDSIFHVKRHLKKSRFHIEPCPDCPDYYCNIENN